MAKVFYTERDIDELQARGVTSLDVHDDVVLTDLARERALSYGLRLNRVRPPAHPEDRADAELHHRVKAAVIGRLGDQVDAAFVDAVIARVLTGLQGK
jgi:hypothetical protein